MLLGIEMEQLIYFLIPTTMLIVGIYLLIIHKRTCPSCGRSIRPFWRQCSCASEPSTVFSPPFEEELDQEPEIGSTAEMSPFPYDQKPGEKREIVSTADTTPVDIKPDLSSFSYDDAQPLSGERMGTEVMLPPISSAWLLIEEPGMPEKRYEIKGAVTSIGTSDDNEIVLKDKAVSRHHSKIRIEGQKYFVYDLASTNGTRVNERKITKKWIKEGDTIEMGHTKMIFKTEASPIEPPEYKHKPSDLLKI